MCLQVYGDDTPCHLTAFKKNCSKRITRARDISNLVFKRVRSPSSSELNISCSEQRCSGAGVKQIFRNRIGLGVKFNVKTGVGVGARITISLSYYCNVH